MKKKPICEDDLFPYFSLVSMINGKYSFKITILRTRSFLNEKSQLELTLNVAKNSIRRIIPEKMRSN